MVRTLVLKAFLLVLPFALVAGVVAWVDPFAYFPWSATRPAPASDLAYRMSPALARLSAFRHAPRPHLLLGDSRMASLDADSLGVLTGEAFANLGYGGGTLEEAIRTFWFADRTVPLESATFGVNLDLYNEANAKDRVSGALQILDQPGLYLCDRLVLRATWHALVRSLTGKQPSIGVPPMSPDAFWNYQLDVTARIAYENYRYPAGFRRRLAEIADHCRRKGIRLRFVVFPEHADLAARARRFGLGPAAERMHTDLEAIGEVVDLAAVVDSQDRSNFTDPYHFSPAVERLILERLAPAGLTPSESAR